MANENGFNRKTIQKVIREHENKNKKFTTLKRHRNRKTIQMGNPHIHMKQNYKTSKNLKRKESNLKMAFRTSNKLNKLISNKWNNPAYRTRKKYTK